MATTRGDVCATPRSRNGVLRQVIATDPYKLLRAQSREATLPRGKTDESIDKIAKPQLSPDTPRREGMLDAASPHFAELSAANRLG